MTWHTAEYWERDQGGRVVCRLCPHHCRPREGQDGLCRARGTRGGELRALSYGRISSANLDPVEKKPLYHFRPGSRIFSIGSWGCNLGCFFCQNWSISQESPPERAGEITPAQAIEKTRDTDCGAIAYTYNEPLVGFEFVRDCARLARAAGMANVLVTNGFLEAEPAGELLPLIAALNIDIKSMEDEFYRRHCRAALAPVLRFCEQAVKAGCHVEITNLLIPTLNDKPETIGALAQWIRERLGRDTPLHLSAYHPDYQCELPPTPSSLLETAYAICRRELSYVYLGNVLTARGQNTLCPQCNKELVERRGYSTRVAGLTGGLCRQCGRKADLLL